MTRRASADLPLHSGSAPAWLFDRMVDLGGAIATKQSSLKRLAELDRAE